MAKYIFHYLLILLPAILTGSLLVIAGDKSDGLKIFILSLFGCFLIIFSNKYKSRKSIAVATWIWWAIFWLHSILLSSSWFLYNSSIDAYFVIQSIANTSLQESTEFIQQNSYFSWVILFLWIGSLLGYYYIIYKRIDFEYIYPKGYTYIMPIILLLLTITAWIIRPIRALSPPVFWYDYHQKIEDFHQQIKSHQQWQEKWLINAQRNISYLPNFSEKQSIIVVLSESVTSYNMSVCAYPRETTPHIQSYSQILTILCKGYSPYASTLPAIKAMLTDAPAGRENYIPKRSLLADAKVAGFKTFWISNQDDIYLSSLFASFADKAVFNNKRSGRSSFSKDEELLPYIADALKDETPRKLIIVHLIGSHPNYSARYPQKFSIFPGKDTHAEAKIADELGQKSAGIWVRQKRNEYDNSIAYQDWIFDQIFTMIKQDKIGWRGLIFVSDHGNEVGHNKDFAGHSPKTEAGYRVPIILWHSQLALPKGINQETPFDAADLEHNVLYFMGLKRKTYLKQVIWTEENYRFSSPLFPYWENYKESKILKSGFTGQEKNLLPDPKNNE